MKTIAGLLIIGLLCACGGGAESDSDGTDGSQDTSVMAVPDSIRTDAPEDESIHTGSADSNAIGSSADICRTQMRTLASAEDMYFAERGNYALPHGLATSGILEDAVDLRCPETDMFYTHTCAAETYTLECSDPGDSLDHGSIIDGIASWE